jgi:ribosomal-protein-alanine N-acetyltransferase
MTEILTKRLKLLRPDLTPETTIKTMVGWLNDPEVVRYSEQRHRDHDEESQRLYILEVDVFREIYTSTSFIGTITAQIDRPNSVADVGILIGDKSAWGKGYGTEAWTAFCNQLFTAGIRKIEAGAMSTNVGMIKIFTKSGMTFEGFRDNHFICGDEVAHMVLWGKFND